jgi:hypothetical protein
VGFVVANLFSTMAEHQPVNWTIFCLVVDENNPFSVEIRPDATVDGLKKAIKKEKHPDFDSFAADRLTLFKVDAPALDLNKAREQIAALDLSSKEMNPLFKLNKYYSAAPPEETIHILVQTPSTRK